MPIPLLAWGIAAVAGAAFGAGRYSRQGEINELKEHIVHLQSRIEQLEKLVFNQNKTISNLKAENKSLNALHFMEKRKLFGRTKGMIIFQYALREYLQFVRLEVEGELSGDKQELVIYGILDRMFYGKEVKLEEKGLIKLYIEGKYTYEIKNLIELEEKELNSALEGKKIG
ncbi:hypothetical protein IEE_04281 [Bacillus cereus BAG5X1-1]|uniref:Uncharacterized protein n=1 Tax=Bacillus cereus BAG5X1-1 TaxID=1053189 RepID=J7XCU0_BACCE|nr:hypothetical protein [Bacillus cereus]EJQ42118.1 hypothetical protein IEE_04281 [Bacillus cereus BAG5X1-1]